jgi:hypothetical protein
MFNFNPFHKQPELTTSEKGLQGTLIYAEKTMTNMSHLADVNRVAANNLIMYGSSSGEDLMVMFSFIYILFIYLFINCICL